MASKWNAISGVLRWSKNDKVQLRMFAGSWNMGNEVPPSKLQDSWRADIRYLKYVSLAFRQAFHCSRPGREGSRCSTCIDVWPRLAKVSKGLPWKAQRVLRLIRSSSCAEDLTKCHKSIIHHTMGSNTGQGKAAAGETCQGNTTAI